MLSYQHGYHAGNFADVHKHMIMVWVLQALNRKAKPWSYLETHAGAARYDFTDEQSQKTGEYKTGIARLWSRNDLPAQVQAYLDQVRVLNPSGALEAYPGSPLIAQQMSREGDNLAVMELHSGEYQRLRHTFRAGGRLAVHHRDGYEGVAALLPPKPNRGVVLIDPAYEVKTEYQHVAKFIVQQYPRWSNGTYAIWYPILKAGQHEEMLHMLKHSGIRNIFRSEFYVQPAGFERMRGSGMVLINPPWQIDQQVAEVMPWLARVLAAAGAAEPLHEWLVPE